MSAHRALRFVHPDFDAGTPGLQVTATGALDTSEDHDAVRQDILLLLSTRPGERVMRPTYGCDVHRLVFAPNNDTTAGLLIHYVRRALETWETRIDALKVDAIPDRAQPARLVIRIAYRVRRTQRPDVVELALDLSGGLSGGADR